jgi:hypothetical protein
MLLFGLPFQGTFPALAAAGGMLPLFFIPARWSFLDWIVLLSQTAFPDVHLYLNNNAGEGGITVC